MVTTPRPTMQSAPPLQITWEKLPDDVPLEEEPVENTGQPLIAGALREALELAGYLKPQMLVAGNLGLCATMDGKLAIKAPDWLYVASAAPMPAGTDRRSYTPHLEGEVPRLVMEFLSHTEGDEYSSKPTYPPGKWFFYEQILQIPTYILFASDTGDLEVYQRQSERYELATPTAENRYWLADMGLFLGVWKGEKEERSGYWLRWWDQAGTLLPWSVEQLEQERSRADQERDRADQERSRADQERDRAAKLAEYLRSQGIDPDAI